MGGGDEVVWESGCCVRAAEFRGAFFSPYRSASQMSNREMIVIIPQRLVRIKKRNVEWT